MIFINSSFIVIRIACVYRLEKISISQFPFILNIYVVVNFLSQVIFIFLLFQLH